MKLKKKIAVSETGFLFDPSSGDSYSLNPVGTEILILIKEGKTESEIKQHFLNNYEVDEGTFDKCLIDFISMLRIYNILEDNGKN